MSLRVFVNKAYERKGSVPLGLGHARQESSDVEIRDGGDEGGIVLDIHRTAGLYVGAGCVGRISGLYGDGAVVISNFM